MSEIKTTENRKRQSNNAFSPIEFVDTTSENITINTELALIQREYAYDHPDQNKGNVEVYLTISWTNMYVIKINFTNYLKKPYLSVPSEILLTATMTNIDEC